MRKLNRTSKIVEIPKLLLASYLQPQLIQATLKNLNIYVLLFICKFNSTVVAKFVPFILQPKSARSLAFAKQIGISQFILSNAIDLKPLNLDKFLLKESWINIEFPNQNLSFMVMFLNKLSSVFLPIKFQIYLVTFLSKRTDAIDVFDIFQKYFNHFTVDCFLDVRNH